MRATSSVEEPKTAKRKVAAGAATGKGKKAKAVPVPVVEKEDEEEEEEDEDEMALEEIVEPPPKGRVKGKKGKDVPVEEPEVEEHGPTATEKRLQQKLDIMIATLEQQKVAFEQLKELRTTKAEDSEQVLTELAAQRQTASLNTLNKYKHSNEELKVENERLRSHFPSGDVSLPPRKFVPASPGSQPSLPEALERIAELEKVVKRVEATKDDALKAAKESERLYEEAVVSLQSAREGTETARKSETESKEREKKWEKKVEKAIAMGEEKGKTDNAELAKDLKLARQELAQEIENSKSLQSKLKSGAGAPSITGGSSSTLVVEKLREELEDAKERLGLNEDFTGLQVTSIITKPEGSSYSCVLTDLLAKNGALNFKVTFPTDGSLCYDPQLDAVRDIAVMELLPVEFRTFMRLDAGDSGKWFKRLFSAMNKI